MSPDRSEAEGETSPEEREWKKARAELWQRRKPFVAGAIAGIFALVCGFALVAYLSQYSAGHRVGSGRNDNPIPFMLGGPVALGIFTFVMVTLSTGGRFSAEHSRYFTNQRRRF